MVKDDKKLTGIQGDIFQQLETPPEERGFGDDLDLDIQAELRAACATALKLARRTGISRETVVDEMNRLMPDLPKAKRVTMRKLNAWQATSNEDYEWPARFIPVFCAATRCDLPLRIMANAIELELADQREMIARQFGEVEIKRALLAQEAKKLKHKLSR